MNKSGECKDCHGLGRLGDYVTRICEYCRGTGKHRMQDREIIDRLKSALISIRDSTYRNSVLALERSLVPLPGVLTPKQAFDKALEKVCTSITSGWFRKFCYDNYDSIQAIYNEDFVQKFQTALEQGRIRPYGYNHG